MWFGTWEMSIERTAVEKRTDVKRRSTPQKHDYPAAAGPRYRRRDYLPVVNTEAMNLHLKEVSIQVVPSADALLICDGAGWHQPGMGS
jgi:hypothetical protein